EPCWSASASIWSLICGTTPRSRRTVRHAPPHRYNSPALREDAAMELRGVVLVEGLSDQAAVEALAGRRGRDLASEGIRVVPIGGAQAIARELERFRARGPGVGRAGLCDAGEEQDFRRGLERAGLGPRAGRAGLERQGFFVCVDDLEDELI